ncbi:MAG TPA: F0F1 ATP synthase subunit A [Pyrinomonadaceae bacterium]|nr:F0F1 ATP synthase subunit A [Pyrinomonadaceae bacterium]
MFFLFSDPAAKAGEAGGHGATAAAESAHHTPAVVEAVNNLVGPPIHDFQLHYTKPIWDNFFHKFGTTTESAFAASPYTPENAVPWYTVMFIIACILSVIVIMILKRGLSEDEPSNRQQALEAGVLAVRNLLYDNVGPHGLKYFPVVATFGVLILISNLMGLIPGLMSPTGSTSVTFAFGISSFVYYNWIGIKENGLFGHLRHFMGPILWLAPLMFPVEIISNLVRPVSLGVRLFGNIFSDEQVMITISGLTSGLLKAPWIVPVLLMPLSVFVAFMQTFIFVLLSMIYIGEVTHGAHDEHHDERHDVHGDENLIAPAL